MGQPVYGTSAIRTAGSFGEGVEFVETDTGDAYLSLGGGDWKQARANGAALVKLAASDVADSILDEFNQPIYSVAGDVTTDGAIYSGLSAYKHWVFQVDGIGSTGATLAIGVSLDGTNFDYVGLKNLGIAGNPVQTVAADGIYILAHTNGTSVWPAPLPVNHMFVDRIAAGTGVGTITVTALGRV